MDWLEPCRLLVGVHRIPAMFTLAFFRRVACDVQRRGESGESVPVLISATQWQSVPHGPGTPIVVLESALDTSSASVMTAARF